MGGSCLAKNRLCMSLKLLGAWQRVGNGQDANPVSGGAEEHTAASHLCLNILEGEQISIYFETGDNSRWTLLS